MSKDNKKGKVSFIVLMGKCAHPDEQTNKKFLAVFSSQNLKLIHKPFSFDINNNSVCNLFKKNILQYFNISQENQIMKFIVFICYWTYYIIIVFDMWSTVRKLPVSPILLYSSDLLVITTQDTHLILNTPQVNFRKHKNWNLTHTHIHIQTDIVTTKNGKQLSSHCSKFTYHVPWMFIFIYTFITSYNWSLLPQLFTGEDCYY